ncbi:MAG: VOC family protein [Myxococcales bacterium]|nr:VOC family protein [Myxococcales bacterium]
MSEPTQGRFVWDEVMSSNPEEVEPFYANLFGWRIDAREMGGIGTYRMLIQGEKPLGGILPLMGPPGVPSHWISYITTEDVDATCAMVTRLGGRVLREPMDIDSVGRFAICADPEGAVFAPFRSSESEAPSGERPPAGTFCWHELMVEDPDGAIGFYSELFGWRFEKMPMPGSSYWVGGHEGVQACGLMRRPPEVPVSHWLGYVSVESAEASLAKALTLGAQPLVGVTPIPRMGRFAVLADPCGAALGLFELA